MISIVAVVFAVFCRCWLICAVHFNPSCVLSFPQSCHRKTVYLPSPLSSWCGWTFGMSLLRCGSSRCIAFIVVPPQSLLAKDVCVAKLGIVG